MLEFVIFAVTVVIFLIIAVIYLMPGNKKVTTVPGPEPVDTLEGNLPDIASCGSFHEFLLDIHSHYGPIASFWWGPKLAVSIGSPELFKEHSKPFDRPAEFYQLFETLLGEDSIQYQIGAEGRKRHSAYAKCFSEVSMKQYYELFNKLSKEFVTKWSSFPSDQHIPLREYSFAYSIKAVLIGVMGSMVDDTNKIMKIRRAYDYVWSEMEDRLRTGVSDMSTTRQKRFDENKAVLVDTVGEIIAQRRKNPPGAGEFLMVDAVLELDLSENAMISDLITGFIASFHTSGLLLTWSMYFLASHKDVQDRLYKELKTVLGQSEVDFENITKLKYLGQVIDETLRCSVLAPYASRFQDFDTELGGHRIAAGTPVVHALGVCLQDPEIFPEPDKFDPERFSPEAVKSRSGYAFQPFGFAGGRKCLGYRFSIAESAVLLAGVLRRFSLELVEGQVVTPVYGLVTEPKEEIWVKVTKR